MKKIIRSTLRLDYNLDYKIKLIAKRNRMSENSMKEYLLELGIQRYLEKYDKIFDYDEKIERKQYEEY